MQCSSCGSVGTFHVARYAGLLKGGMLLLPMVVPPVSGDTFHRTAVTAAPPCPNRAPTRKQRAATRN
jgi:hypothetical protein